MAIYNNILSAVDFSDSTTSVLQHSAALAEQLNCKLIILHVVDYAPSPDIDRVLPPADETENRLMNEAKSRLNSLLALASIHVSPRALIVTGHPKIEIVRIAEKESADLIIIGAHGKHRLAGLLKGSTEGRILDRATCDVLVVR